MDGGGITMRNRATCLVLSLALAASAASAGEIYGTVSEGGKPVADGTTVAVKCGDKAYPAVKTDKTGTYHLTVAEKGKCTLTLSYKGQSPALEVASYDQGVQVDLVLEAKDGKYTARRK
jgi:hypothetical protein